ncbi:cupin [Hwanghaeella grinnelliae]|uniref:Cupin n=1 Tax=Hwanghaeella grinnelliae TaxID=2500179 RepID=A0A437QQM1_9PROT|nr:cupin domain-containing protein [Hwanghaeella grinnelliae]RVU36810.1 cupin [Hwanghaeella grinnelliae]
MEVNTNFGERVALRTDDMDWVPSPMQGVDRRMLDRIGDEVARATSIVRYAPNSSFSAHTHAGGEEFLVLDGVFQDDYGDFPVGSYIRNPPTSSHTPRSDEGCTIFVKLWQFDADDRTYIRKQTADEQFLASVGEPGVELLPLYKDAMEDVRMERWAPEASVDRGAPGGLELLVLEGSLTEGSEELPRNTWLRLPRGSDFLAKAGPGGALFWIKTGHLAEDPQPPEAG